MGSVTFLGAAGTVTGSCTLLRWGRTWLLVDCGLFQGPEEIAQLNFRTLAFDPRSIDAVLLTHAHLDHSGLLPRLYREGFRGQIYSSRPTRGLLSLVLLDAAHLQEEEARFARKRGYSRHPDPRPLFTVEEARRTLGLVDRLPFDTDHEIRPGIHLRLSRAGHLLGAASITLTAKDGRGRRRRWGFSGDVGRYGVPILKDPEPPTRPLDALVLESTYGDRSHDPGNARRRFRSIVRRTFDRGGSVLIPAFSLGRTQEVLFHLSGLVAAGHLDASDVFLDSPMAIEATQLYEQAKAEHDEELAELVSRRRSPLRQDAFPRCRSVAQSKALNTRHRPAVIVAGSGMCTGGRIVHHLAHRLGDPRHSVVFVGYQAAGTRGRSLVDGASAVVIHGREVPVRARIHDLHMLSAHADRDELRRWCGDLEAVPDRVFLNHGEDGPRKVLEQALVADGWPRPTLPSRGTEVPW